MFDSLLEKYEDKLELLKGDKAEIDEMYEDYNPSDWSGGNFDDAYELGKEHGEVFTEMNMIRVFIKELEEMQSKNH